MKKYIIISLLCSFGIISASAEKTPGFFERTFGRRETTPPSTTAPSSSTEGGFFSRFRSSTPSTSSAPAESKPGFFARHFGKKTPSAAPAPTPGFGPTQPSPRQGLAGASREFLEGASMAADEQKKEKLKQWLQGHVFQSRMFDMKEYKDLLPHLRRPKNSFTWYEILNVSKFANKRQVENAKNRIISSVKAFPVKAPIIKGTLELFLNTLYNEWERMVYKNAPYKDLWDRGVLK